MACMLSTIANKGTYVEPRIVKKIINSQTKEVIEIETKRRENVISEETAQSVLSMMETVVSEGTGKNSKVMGYRIGGKTGTSEDGVNTGKYVTSFIGVAPISNPEVVILVTLYNPTGEGGHQGGGVAAPIGAQLFGEILPYLEVVKDDVTEEEVRQEIETPSIIGLSIKEATEELEAVGLILELKLPEGTEEKQLDKTQTKVKTQVPKAGIKIVTNTKVMVEIE